MKTEAVNPDDDARTADILERLGHAGWSALAHTIAAIHRIPLGTVLGRSRCKRIVAARQHLCAILRWTTLAGYPDIAWVLDLDHATVMAAERKHGARLEQRFGEPGPWEKAVEKRSVRNKLYLCTRAG